MDLIAIVDANILFPYALRDTVLRAANERFFRVRWSATILDELQRNLVSKHIVSTDKALRLRTRLEEVFPKANVTNFEHLIPAMPNHIKDRHVVAAAVRAGAEIIATANMKDFRQLPHGIIALPPDQFLCRLFEMSPERFVNMLRQQARDMQKPPQTCDGLLAHLSQTAPRLIEKVREFHESESPPITFRHQHDNDRSDNGKQ